MGRFGSIVSRVKKKSQGCIAELNTKRISVHFVFMLYLALTKKPELEEWKYVSSAF